MIFDAKGSIPHQPPMFFIDSVVLDQDGAKALTLVRDDWVILDDKGAGPELPEAAYFELMAQGYAAISSIEAREAGTDRNLERPKAGFLVGVKRFECLRRARPGDELQITTANHNSLGPFHVFDAFVRLAGGELAASGQIKIFLADDAALQSAGIEAAS